jgi:signal peptidase I
MSPDEPHRSDLEAADETRQVRPPDSERGGATGPGADLSSAPRGSDGAGTSAPAGPGPSPDVGPEQAPNGAGRGKDGDDGTRQQGVLAVVRETALLVVLAILLAVLFKTFLVQAFYIPSGSMEPTLNVSDRVLVEKVSYRFGHVKDGDVVVFVHDLPGVEPESANPVARFFTGLGQAIGVAPPSDRDFIKRVVGTPGDRITCQLGKLYRNGSPVNEPYLAPGTTTENCTPTTVKPGQLYVMGDNRNNSEDSRTFGPIDRSALVGRAFVRIWPLSHTGWLRRDQ